MLGHRIPAPSFCISSSPPPEMLAGRLTGWHWVALGGTGMAAPPRALSQLSSVLAALPPSTHSAPGTRINNRGLSLAQH